MLPYLSFLDISSAFKDNLGREQILTDCIASKNRKVDIYFGKEDENIHDNEMYRRYKEIFFGIVCYNYN